MSHGRRYSLRRHVWIVVALIALVPVLFVTLGSQLDYVVREVLEARIVDAKKACGEAIRSQQGCVDIADSESVWLRVYRDGELIEERDAASGSTASWIERMISNDVENLLREHDPLRGLSPSELPDQKCDLSYDRLLVCSGAETFVHRDHTFHVVAVNGDVRSVRALSVDGVTKLAMQMLLVALLVGWWLGRRIVKPMETLRDRVLARRGRSEFEPILSEDQTEVGEIASAFDELLTEVDEKRRANEAFAADLAHDLKTPIATILTSAENIETAGELTTEEAERHARVLRRSGERLNQVVGEFLDLARAEAGLREDPREEVDVEALLEAILSQLETQQTINFESRPARVAASPRYLQTALANVITNAIQVTDETGVVDILVDVEGDDVVIEIRDDGPGISVEDLPRIFDRFFTRRRGGTGLGLPMARAIARAHGGDLTVSTSPDDGALFRFRFPSYESHTQIINE